MARVHKAGEAYSKWRDASREDLFRQLEYVSPSVQSCDSVVNDHLSDWSWIDAISMTLEYLYSDVILDVFDLLTE